MKAPNFELPDQYGNLHKLNDYSSQWLVIYFYPKDNTPGCIIEACNFRDGREFIESAGAKVIGISKDAVASHKKFSDKQNLNFSLLSDPSTKTIKAYGAWGKKKLMGHKYEGILRNTYLIDPDGKVVKKYEAVNPKTHVREIIKDLKKFSHA
jgi:peroxiredoxin Q/BCP